ncbi:MAG: homoserine O-acetyltransferase [Thermoanaerobaculales bacterium]|nr:homoserine O-acetyltransferase [Thermoanaerobaculales bacterium]
MSPGHLSPIDASIREIGDFRLESGEVVPDARIAYRSWGTLNPSATNAVVVCHALTGSPDVDLWWPALLGPGRAFDPLRDFVICCNVLGSSYGSTGPASLRPGTDHRWGADFPATTVADTVRAHRRVLDDLGVRSVRFATGGSLGGMQSLEWALQDDRVAAVAVVAASARHSAWAIAISDAQRAAIAADPNWCGGHYDPSRPPAAGLAAARRMAMCSYRTPQSLGERFGRRRADDGRFEIESWLDYHGGALVQRFDASCYVHLTRTMDSHDIGRGRGGVDRALASIRIPVLAVSIDSDGLYPPTEQIEIAEKAPLGELVRLSSPHGHDAFLIEVADLNEQLVLFRGRAAATRRRMAEGEAS